MEGTLFSESTCDKLFDPRLIHASKQRSSFAGKASLLHVRVVVALHCPDEFGFLAANRTMDIGGVSLGLWIVYFSISGCYKGRNHSSIEPKNFHASHKDINIVDWI